MVDPDAMAVDMAEVAAEPAADVEHETEIESAQVPAVGRLHVEHTPDPPLLEPGEATRVGSGLGGRRIHGRVGRNRCQWASIVPTTTANDVRLPNHNNVVPIRFSENDATIAAMNGTRLRP